jgi:hypothetical protein
MNMNHTPTPWSIQHIYAADNTLVYCKFYQTGNKAKSIGFAGIYRQTEKQRVSDDEAQANAAFIVRACNSYDDTQRALLEIAALPTHPCDDARNLSCLETAKRIAQAALKLAKGDA